MSNSITAGTMSSLAIAPCSTGSDHCARIVSAAIQVRKQPRRVAMSSTIVSEFFERARTRADDVAFRYKRDGEWTPITWGEYGRLVTRVAGGLRALGFDGGEKGAIISNNRYEWQVADLAIESCGGITVPIYQTNSPPQVAYITGHSESKMIFV